MKKLIKWADVFIENNAPGVVAKFGLDYENVKKIKPDIIMVSSCQMGQKGVYAKFKAFGTQSAGMAGFHDITGYPPSEIVGPRRAYTDVVTPQWLVTAILASVDYRNRTGLGQYLDNSQLETGIHFLTPMLLDYTFNGRLMKPRVTGIPVLVPDGYYRCRGDDRWCSIAVRTDQEWTAFCRVIGEEVWTRDPKFATFLDRKRNEDELDHLVDVWTINYSPEEVMQLMQSAGVPAGIVATGEDLSLTPN